LVSVLDEGIVGDKAILDGGALAMPVGISRSFLRVGKPRDMS